MLKLIKNNWAQLTTLVLAVVTLVSLYPADQLPQVPGSDKTHHLISYALVIFPAALAKPRYLLMIALAVFAWSGAIELIQPHVNRYGEWLDLAANGAGVAIGLIAGWLLNRWLLNKRTGD
ncbi:hypothetical protein [Bacterioplanoides sp.]|uniref:hypothetical protein n=1 Tax=Bacterioplanoides sp. TaxID=2066072 RepID=UPI003B5B4431